MDPKTLQFVIPILILLPVLYFRMRSSLKPQRLKPQTLLLRPGIIIIVALLVLAAAPPRVEDLPWFLIAAAAGAGAGWYWGKLTKLDLHPEDGTVISTGSQAGMLVLVALVLFRYGMRAGLSLEREAMHLDVAMITDISIVFSALLFSARGLEIYLRAQPLLRYGTPSTKDMSLTKDDVSPNSTWSVLGFLWRWCVSFVIASFAVGFFTHSRLADYPENTVQALLVANTIVAGALAWMWQRWSIRRRIAPPSSL
jgi:hypothetical protein